MNNTLAYRQLLFVVITFLLLVSFARGQDTNRLVDWQVVVPGSDARVLEIVDISANGIRITTGHPFSADDDWLDKLTFRIRNASDKTITLFAFGVAFPEIDLGGGRSAMLSIAYDAKSTENKFGETKPILPGAVVDLKLPSNQLVLLRQLSMKRTGTIHLTRVNILPGLVNFADGSRLGGISLRKP